MRVAFVGLLVALAVISFIGLTARAVLAEELRVLRAVPAIYPNLAIVAQQSGTVTVELTIKPEGIVVEANSINGHKLFRNTAERSARLWVFNATADSQSVRSARLI